MMIDLHRMCLEIVERTLLLHKDMIDEGTREIRNPCGFFNELGEVTWNDEMY